MINYMKSENYRLLRKKGLYIISLLGLLLITAAAIVLYFSGAHVNEFPYATSAFFYANVIGSNVLVLIIAFLFNLGLTGRDMALVKQSISFGISRGTIFWSKFTLTLSYFLLICLIGILLMIGLGESLLASEGHTVQNFLSASFNMLPIVLSGFCMVHMFKMIGLGDAYVIVILFVFYVFSGDLLRLLLGNIPGLDEAFKYAPSTLLDDNLMSYMDMEAGFDYRYWLVGILIAAITLLIGASTFAKQNID